MPQASRSWPHRREVTKRKTYLRKATTPKPLLSLTTISLSVLMPRVHHPKETTPAMIEEESLSEPVLCDLRKNVLMRLLRLSFRISNI